MHTLLLSITAIVAGALPAPPPLPPPTQFVGRVTNPWFPLTPGTVLVYRGEKDGSRGRDVFTVARQRRMILGIRATVVSDRLYLARHLAERTTDWYAQDRTGNVWYLGERTATLNARGRVTSADGTWLAGVGGARAGIYMPAHPAPGEAGRQEYDRGHAEDQYKVLGLGAHVSTPAVSSDHALLTQETTRLEPGALDHKLYVRGIGTVVEQTIRGGSERFVLTSVTHHERRRPASPAARHSHEPEARPKPRLRQALTIRATVAARGHRPRPHRRRGPRRRPRTGSGSPPIRARVDHLACDLRPVAVLVCHPPGRSDS
jgi:hypothetical protein